jgi:hypothetical protein
MAERTEDVQAHWTRPGVLARIDAADRAATRPAEPDPGNPC